MKKNAPGPVLVSFSTAAQAYESLAPHTHPHGVSVLPGIDIVACGLLALVAALIAYRKFGRTPFIPRECHQAWRHPIECRPPAMRIPGEKR